MWRTTTSVDSVTSALMVSGVWCGLVVSGRVCVLDLRHICQNLNQFGHGKGTVYGGCSEFTIVPSKYAYLLTTGISDEAAVIMERE